jgi:hypothetical protein
VLVLLPRATPRKNPPSRFFHGFTIPIAGRRSYAVQSNEIYPHGPAPGHVCASAAVRINLIRYAYLGAVG